MEYLWRPRVNGVTAIASASSLDYPALASHALNRREIKNVRREKVPLSTKHLEAMLADVNSDCQRIVLFACGRTTRRVGVYEIDSNRHCEGVIKILFPFECVALAHLSK